MMKRRTKRLIVGLGLLVISTCLTSLVRANDPAAAAANIKQIIAHRGARAERPENTLASARRAIEVGATAVEVDVRTTQDGFFVLLHDDKLDRTTNGNGSVGQITLAELRKL